MMSNARNSRKPLYVSALAVAQSVAVFVGTELHFTSVQFYYAN